MLERHAYRKQIYDRYVSGFQGLPQEFNQDEAKKRQQSYTHYFRGWLPTNKDADILDLACGNGTFLYMMKELGYQNLKGVEISPEQAKMARTITPHIEEQDILKCIKTSKESFDLITGIDIIEHFDKNEALEFIEGCFAALRPGGRLILQTPNAESIWSNAIRYGDFTHEICFQPNLLSSLLKINQFEHVECREGGPIFGNSPFSSVRYVLWKVLRMGFQLSNLIETGAPGSGVFTRVFMISATKPTSSFQA